jgi:hypothetical protein
MSAEKKYAVYLTASEMRVLDGSLEHAGYHGMVSLRTQYVDLRNKVKKAFLKQDTALTGYRELRGEK